VAQAVYLVSILGLALLLARPVLLVYSASQERAAQAVSSSLGKVIDSMSPGTSVVIRLEGYPGVLMKVDLGGKAVSASFEGATATAPVRWELPVATLVPGEEYNFTLVGGEIELAQARHG